MSEERVKEVAAMPWIVERFEHGATVFQGKILPGCPFFGTEGEALQYAIDSETNEIETLRRNRKALRARLGKVQRLAVSRILEEQRQC